MDGIRCSKYFGACIYCKFNGTFRFNTYIFLHLPFNCLTNLMLLLTLVGHFLDLETWHKYKPI